MDPTLPVLIVVIEVPKNVQLQLYEKYTVGCYQCHHHHMTEADGFC